MDVKTEIINKEKVEPINLPSSSIDKIKGSSLIPALYTNIYILGMTNSGKSSVIFKLIRRCTSKSTKMYLISSTHEIDKVWIYIIKWLKQNDYDIELYHDSNQGKLYKDLIAKWQIEDKPIEEKKIIKPAGWIRMGDENKAFFGKRPGQKEDSKPKVKKESKVSPKRMLIIDDVDVDSIRSKNLYEILKSSRHYQLKTICSSQFYCDMLPSSRQQISFFLLFPRMDDERLKMIYKCTNFSISINNFIEIYQKYTAADKDGKKSYNFLYCNLIESEFRQNFNKRLIIKD